jgi:hypothetical protein
MSMQVHYTGSSDPNCAVMVQKELLESAWMIAYGVVWCRVVWRGMDLNGMVG